MKKLHRSSSFGVAPCFLGPYRRPARQCPVSLIYRKVFWLEAITYSPRLLIPKHQNNGRLRLSLLLQQRGCAEFTSASLKQYNFMYSVLTIYNSIRKKCQQNYFSKFFDSRAARPKEKPTPIRAGTVSPGSQGFVRTFGLNVLRIDLFLVQLGLTLFCFDRQYLYLSGSPRVTQNKEAFQTPGCRETSENRGGARPPRWGGRASFRRPGGPGKYYKMQLFYLFIYF